MTHRRWITAPFAILALAACDDRGAAQAADPDRLAGAQLVEAPACTVAGRDISLPQEVRESSGLAQSARDPGLFWTHNDAGNDAEIFAVGADGALAQRVRVAGAEAVDWEDIEIGPCGSGRCLFIGDIGDNDAERERITIYRIPEPEEGETETATAEPIHARYPEGPRDAESLFVLPSGEMFVVTKGRRGPIELYRFPSTASGETVTLARVQQLLPEPETDDDRVTAATASPDGRWVAIRSYRNLYLYPAAALTAAGEVEPTIVDLTPLEHDQGESVVISADGTIWMSSEAENEDSRPVLGRLRCTLSGD